MESVSIIKSMGISISTLTSRHLSGKFPLLSYGRPVDVKQIRNRYQQRSNKAKNTARPWNSQIMEHRIHEQRERRRENASQKGISSDCWGGKFLERVYKVVQRCLEDGEESEAHADQAYHGSDPWDIFVGGPAKDEKAAWKKDRADHHWW